MPNITITSKELEFFLWQLDHASAELTSFVDSNYSVSELDRVDDANTMLGDALYENCKGSTMTMPEKLKELLKQLETKEQISIEGEVKNES
jgi:hypothetical protein